MNPTGNPSTTTKPVHPSNPGHEHGRRWAIVLAAGDGTRLGHLTRDASGRSTPKQFCSVSGGPTLLQETLARGADLVGEDRVVTVVAAKHAEWWGQDTAGLDPRNVVIQPDNRGTAAGILLPLLTIARRDPAARVVVLPSDHFIEREAVLARAAREAFATIERDPDAVVLLGITPERPDPELGWILPEPEGRGRVGRVRCFVEKPSAEIADDLLRRGSLWNSFIFTGTARTLLELYRRSLPALLETLTRAVDLEAAHGKHAAAVASAYRGLASADFSRDLLQPNAEALRVLAVDPCGWSDLGTPERLVRCAGAFAGLATGSPAARRIVAAWAPSRPVLAAIP